MDHLPRQRHPVVLTVETAFTVIMTLGVHLAIHTHGGICSLNSRAAAATAKLKLAIKRSQVVSLNYRSWKEDMFAGNGALKASAYITYTTRHLETSATAMATKFKVLKRFM